VFGVADAGQLNPGVDDQDAAVDADGGELLAALEGERAPVGSLDDRLPGVL
jgi:hypothetical protein